MAPEANKSSRVRLFAALDLPEQLRIELGEWGGRELTDPALRPVAAPNLHITFAFLGHRPEREIGRVAAALEQCAGPAPRVELLDSVARPARGRPRMFALPVLSPAAERIQARLSALLVSECLYEPEKRLFWPHVTVARVRAEGRGSRRPQAVSKVPGELPAAARKPCFCRRLTLYRSELQPSGAHYVPLAQVKLSAEDGSEVI
jgi:RNA 2',3'-cyclic 3'-phosphodiesterase